jgi:hypothetical protein
MSTRITDGTGEMLFGNANQNVGIAVHTGVNSYYKLPINIMGSLTGESSLTMF